VVGIVGGVTVYEGAGCTTIVLDCTGTGVVTTVWTGGTLSI